MADVLVVDDDADLREVVMLVLESAGHAVRTAADGRDGLDLLHERIPDAIVLDVEMPHMTGPDLAYRMFVEDAGLDRVPIVLVSGVVDVKGVAAKVGTPYYLTKPCAAERLSAMLDRALAERVAPVPPPRPALASRTP